MLSDWQAFTTLWRQQWMPASEDGRGQRIAALAITMLLELLLLIALLWLGYARWGGAPPPPGEEVVQVEFIGIGTPEEQGGGAPTGPEPQPQAAASSAPSSAAATATPRAATGLAPPRRPPSEMAANSSARSRGSAR